VLGSLLLVAGAFASVALAGGGSTLGKPHFQPTGLNEVGPVAVADLNGDGRKDIVTAGHSDQVISVLYGAKHGFKSFKTYDSSYVPSWLAIGDVNRDGRPDIVYSSFEVQPVVMLAKHGGGFQAASPLTTGHAASFAVLTDLNHDHKLDLVTSDADPASTVSVFLGNGNGNFAAAKDISIPIPGDPFTLVATDINKDGDQDVATLVTGTDNGSIISPLYGNGHGDLTGGASRIVTASHLFGMVAGHFNSDNRLDLAADYCGSVYLLYGSKSDTGFANPHHYPNDSSACPLGPVAGDLNGDGRSDLVTTDEASEGRKVSVMLGKRGGGLGPFKLYPALKTGTVSRYLAIADFNGDRRADVAAPGDTGSRRGVSVLYGKKN
jgi:hypothetical protein